MAKEFKYKEVLKAKEFRKLLFSNLINRFGDSVDGIAFTGITDRITHIESWEWQLQQEQSLNRLSLR